MADSFTHEIIPAFDFKDGELKRLHQGDYDQQISFDHVDHMQRIAAYEQAGIKMIHLVNLDAAKAPETKEKSDRKIIEIIKRFPKITFDKGGGIRSVEDVEEWLDYGNNVRISIGTWAFTGNQDDIRHIIEKFGSERFSVDIAYNNGRMAIHGWQEQSLQFDEGIKHVRDLGFQHAVVTDKSKDGADAGPNLDIVKEVMSNGISAIVSGGVRDTKDLNNIRSRFLKNPLLEGVIIGTAQLKDPQIVYDGIEIFQGR